MEKNIKRIKEIIFNDLDNSRYDKDMTKFFGWYIIRLKSGIRLYCYKSVIYKVKVKRFFGSFIWYENRLPECKELEYKISDIIQYNIYPSEITDFMSKGFFGRMRNFFHNLKSNRIKRFLDKIDE